MSRRSRAKRRIRTVETSLIPNAVLEAQRNRRNSGTAKSFSLAWDETEALGITADMRRSGPGMLSDQDRKDTLYQSYLNSVWISACVDVIAKRITSGGMVIELTENGKENQKEYDELHAFLHYINDDEDFLHLVRSIATDILIYGDAYLEIVTKAGKPFSLHKIDCVTMNYELDKHGAIIGYKQNMTHSTETVPFTPDQVIRWWLADPKAGKKALSPIERVLGSIDSEVHMADWVRSFFRKGARPPFWIQFPGSKEEAQRFVVWLRENYTGQANAHVPLVLYDNSQLHEIGKGAVDMDFVKGRELACKEILAAYQVPPALVGLIESGNIGGGTGESQEKSFQFNACDPIRHLIFEKFNDRIVKRGFGIANYRVNTRYANFLSDGAMTKILTDRIHYGILNVNEARAELGKNQVEGGDENVIIAGKEILAIETLAGLKEERDQNMHLDLELKRAQVEKAKQPTEQQDKPEAQKEEPKEHIMYRGLQALSKESEHHTGMMLAFMLDRSTAKLLAIPGGEPINQLHCTLAYLGDMEEEPEDDLLRPHTSPSKIRDALNLVVRDKPPLRGNIMGLGRFQPAEEEKDPIIALVDVPGLVELRTRLVTTLKEFGYFVAENHGYTPHITLAYVDRDAPNPIDAVPSLPLVFDTITLAIGDEYSQFPLTPEESRA